MTMIPVPGSGASTQKMLDIVPRLDEISVALTWLRALAAEARWPERVAFGLILSADEALTNIVTHAFGRAGSDSSVIHLACFDVPQGIALRIEDEGPVFDPTQAAPGPQAESIEDAEMGGHGLRLMRHYLKTIKYAREGHRNVLTLVAG